MKQMKLWMLAAILTFSGASLLTSCSEEDNPVPEPKIEERQAFEKQLSADLEDVAEYINLDPTLKAIEILTSFTNNLNAEALGNQVMDILTQILSNAFAENPTCQFLSFDELGDQKEEALNALANSLHVSEPSSFVLVDAYNSIGTRHMTFKTGEPQAVITEDDALVVEYQDAELGETTELRLKFNDERDGVIIFVANALGSPIAVQFPETIGITITTGKNGEPKQVLEGTVDLNTTDGTKYMSFKGSSWSASANLLASVVGRKEQITATVDHSADGELSVMAGLSINDRAVLTLGALGVRNPYSAEEMEQLKELRSMGSFYSTAYELLKALNGRTIDALTLTINENIYVKCKVNDVAEALKALGNLHLQHDIRGSKEAVDVYTQQLNGVLEFSVIEKNTGISADGSLLTILKEGEYQPAVALRFDGETEFQAVYDNLSEQDLVNYKKIIESFREPIATFNKLLAALQEKAGALKGALPF